MARKDDIWVPLTDELRSRLRDLQAQSGVGPVALLRGTQADRPQGLTSDTITRWLRQGQRARKDCLEYVLRRWETRVQNGAGRIPVTSKIQQQLWAERQRTGINPRQLLQQAEIPPVGLTPAIIRSWLARKAQTARLDHLEFALQQWATLPDRPTPIKDAAERINLSSAAVADLRQLRDRSGVSLHRLFASWTPPPGLTEAMVDNWLAGTTSTALRHHVESVQSRWRELGREQGGRIQISEEMHARLQTLQDRSGLGPKALLDRAENIPKGLTVNTIAGWLNRQSRTALMVHWNFVIRIWEPLIDESGKA